MILKKFIHTQPIVYYFIYICDIKMLLRYFSMYPNLKI